MRREASARAARSRRNLRFAQSRFSESGGETERGSRRVPPIDGATPRLPVPRSDETTTPDVVFFLLLSRLDSRGEDEARLPAAMTSRTQRIPLRG